LLFYQKGTSMGASLERLLTIAGKPLGERLLHVPEELLQQADKLGEELVDMLMHKNGYFAFESALHVFPVGPSAAGYDLSTWNSFPLWRSRYGAVTHDCCFFAEDIFGEQFCMRSERIWRFNPETGEHTQIATTLEEWATRVLGDYDLETGYPLAHAWQERYGPLHPDQRLVPIIPFVLGGAFSIANLQILDAVTGMHLRAELAQQIRHLPDRTQVRLRIDGE
jgi:hypothetical protein